MSELKFEKHLSGHLLMYFPGSPILTAFRLASNPKTPGAKGDLHE
jgi:hypothetical protein